MKEKPILFSGPMVKAILEGRKTMTRRVMKKNVPVVAGDVLRWFPGGEKAGFCHTGTSTQTRIDVPSGWAEEWCPYGQPGTILWIRETVWLWGKKVKNGITKTGRQKWKFVAVGQHVRYVADSPGKPDERIDETQSHGWHKRPAIFMPYWACREKPVVTGVRVERLQDISEADARAEGITIMLGWEFHELWDAINAKRGHGWDKNDWVWVIEFKRVAP